MNTPLSTLPGDIPGLLRRGSPVLYTEALIPGVVLALIAEELGEFSDPPILSVALFGQHVIEDRCVDIAWRDRRHITLDLTDPTGRVHAAWWVAERVEAHSAGARSALTGVEYRAWTDATQGRDMTALAIDTLARLVLRLAGRQP